MNDQQCTQFLSEIRRPLLALHKAILDHERASYEKEFGPVTPAAFLQVLINGTGFRWLTPLSTIIANVDEILDDKEADATDRIAAAEAVTGLFSPTSRIIFSCRVICRCCRPIRRYSICMARYRNSCAARRRSSRSSH